MILAVIYATDGEIRHSEQSTSVTVFTWAFTYLAINHIRDHHDLISLRVRKPQWQLCRLDVIRKHQRILQHNSNSNTNTSIEFLIVLLSCSSHLSWMPVLANWQDGNSDIIIIIIIRNYYSAIMPFLLSH